MPQVELAAKCIATTGDRPDPGGFGPIPSTWMPRAQAFDDLDAPSGPTNGCPYAEKPPAALFNCAPLDQRFVDPIGSSDVLHLKGFFQDLPITETVTLSLPSISVNAAVLDGAHGRPLSLVCDTLLVDCDARTLCLVHRAAIPVRLEDDPAGVVLIR